ncbi:Transcription factor TGA2.2 [Vitis vinifera]|uniref:Transcription factor TGA2.2 n=1 Tax=Vitis vinifera TaxID=29760 RepID=A0A438DLS5_VITVI|nr:Transcription factor TGA2.2 [Vitis vinifera]
MTDYQCSEEGEVQLNPIMIRNYCGLELELPCQCAIFKLLVRLFLVEIDPLFKRIFTANQMKIRGQSLVNWCIMCKREEPSSWQPSFLLFSLFKGSLGSAEVLEGVDGVIVELQKWQLALGSLKERNRLWKVVAASIGKIMVGGGSMASVVGNARVQRLGGGNDGRVWASLRQKCGSTYKSKALFCSLGEDNGETERRVLFHVYWCSLSKREESANIFRDSIIVGLEGLEAYVQQLESSRMKLTQLEQELQRARQQGIFISSSGDQAHSMSGNGAMAFDVEYARWLEEQNRQINELRSAVNSHASDAELRVIVDNIMAHYDDIFRLKGVAAKADVFHLLSGMWKTPAERCFLWLGGFRSSELLKVLIGGMLRIVQDDFHGIVPHKCDIKNRSIKLNG